MKTLTMLSIAVAMASPVIAESKREADAHEHGVGQLDIAFEGKKILMELHAPGADIVGFEYAAKSEEDHAAIDAAVAKLSVFDGLFGVPADAGCKVVMAEAALEGDDDHDEDGHDDHNDEEATHTEFHAEYLLECTNPTAMTEMTFAYFAQFPNAKELELQVATEKSASAFEVERDMLKVDLSDLF